MTTAPAQVKPQRAPQVHAFSGSPRLRATATAATPSSAFLSPGIPKFSCTPAHFGFVWIWRRRVGSGTRRRRPDAPVRLDITAAWVRLGTPPRISPAIPGTSRVRSGSRFARVRSRGEYRVPKSNPAVLGSVAFHVRPGFVRAHVGHGAFCACGIVSDGARFGFVRMMLHGSSPRVRSDLGAHDTACADMAAWSSLISRMLRPTVTAC